MKKMKKLCAVFLAFMLAFSLCVTAFAAYEDTNPAGAGSDGTVGTADDYGKVTVSGFNDAAAVKNNLTVSVYPVFLAIYDQTTGAFSGYVSLYPEIIESVEELPTDDDGNYTITEELLIQIEKALADAAAGGDLSAGAEKIYSDACDALDNSYTFGSNARADYTLIRSENDVDGYYSYSSGSVAVGSYLVHVTESEAVEYTLAMVSSYYQNLEGQNVLQPGEVNMVGTGNAWVKADKPGVDKKITNTSTTTHDDYYELNNKGTSVNIGDTVEYEVTVNNIPHYAGDYPVFNLTDTLSEGLTYVPSTGVVVKAFVGIGAAGADGDGYITLTENTDYTLTEPDTGNNQIKIDFVVDGKYTLNDYAEKGYSLVICYSVILNENATLNQYSNDNYVDLDYSVDSTEQGSDSHDDDTTHTYTYDIDGYLSGEGEYPGTPGWNESGSITRNVLTKTGDYHWVDDQGETVVEGTEGAHYTELLKGAVFQLYTDENCSRIYTNAAMQNEQDGIITDANGRFAIYGLAAGTYYLQEKEAPAGYALNSTVYQIVIDETLNDDGELIQWIISINIKNSQGQWTSTGSSTFDLSNLSSSTFEGEDVPVKMTNYEQDFTTEINGAGYSFVYVDKQEIDGGTVYRYEGYSGAYNDDAKDGVQYTDSAYQLTITVTEEGASVVWNLDETATVTGNAAEIVNTTTPELPSTGGIGTTIFTIVGCLIIAGAVVLFVTLRRKNRKTAE